MPMRQFALVDLPSPTVRDIPRTVAAISGNTDLARLLRDGIPMHAAQVRPLLPADAATELDTLREVVWAVVTDTPEAAPAVTAFCRGRAALVFWLGPALPAGMPRHSAVSPTWRVLLGDVNEALQKQVAGMKLARQYGVELPGGDFTDSTALEVLIGAYPSSVEVARSATTHLNRLLVRHQISCRVDRTASSSVLVESTS